MGTLTRRRFLAHSTAAGVGAVVGAGCGRASEDTPGAEAGRVVAEEAVAGESPGSRPPHIVLIMLDTLRADKLGCYGYPHDTSPALDALAARGVVFERAVAQCSWTRPSVGSLLTSRYARDLGLYVEHNEILNSRFETIGTLLKQHGYTTFGATANPNMNRSYNFHLGFDEYIESAVVFSWMEEAHDDNVRGRVSLPSAPRLYEQTLDFARRHPQGPCYVQLNLMEIHEWYVRDNYTLRRPEYQGLFLDVGERYPKYLQSVRQLTDDTAGFMEALSGLAGWEDTLFVILSDHGEGLDDHPGIAKSLYHGWLLYESQVVVPWILYRPGWTPAQRRIAQPVRLLELLPTVLDFAGAPIPEDIAGVSLKPLVEGRVASAALPEYFITETDFRGASKVGAYAAAWKYFNNIAPHAGLPPHELQARGGREQGLRTNQSRRRAEDMEPLRAYVEAWMREHPKTPPTPQLQALSEEERRQLEAIGYLGDEEETP
ncbi:MAG TPA: sulfatase [Candidatus Hydrogenedentes bacterium]|nr:sulfatase [Candidatus Hydrogenedentota bacterium]